MRIALDTNVVSELTHPQCDANVLEWSTTHDSNDLYLPAPCWAELRRGVALLPRGRRRDSLSVRLVTMVEQLGGILPFGRDEAEIYADLTTEPGRPRPTVDAMIATICRTNDLPLATRNVSDFDGCGITVINPWHPSSNTR